MENGFVAVTVGGKSERKGQEENDRAKKRFVASMNPNYMFSVLFAK